ncbi:MAG: DUF6328 family protein [Frankia sp.]
MVSVVGGGRPDESPLEQLDRNWLELLQELRVAEAGVQILFAFLLTLPFTQRWTRVTEFGHVVYVVALLLSAVASALLIGPVAYHRLTFGRHARARLIRTSNVMALAGLAALALAICSSVLLVADVIAGPLATALIGAGIGTTFVVLWLVVPLVGRHEQVEADEYRAPPGTPERR